MSGTVPEFVEVSERRDTGKNANRRLRRDGKVPAIVYGLGLDPYPVAVPPKIVEDIIQTGAGQNAIFKLQLEGNASSSRAAMIKTLQRDPLTMRLVHVDFIRVDLEKKVQVDVPVHLVGTALGVKNEGGILEFIQREVSVECLPGSIPDHLDFDVSELHIGQNVHVSDLQAPEGVVILDEAETVLAHVAGPQALELEAEAEEAAEEEGAEAPGEEASGEGSAESESESESES